jgi:hypothetical protein
MTSPTPSNPRAHPAIVILGKMDPGVVRGFATPFDIYSRDDFHYYYIV